MKWIIECEMYLLRAQYPDMLPQEQWGADGSRTICVNGECGMEVIMLYSLSHSVSPDAPEETSSTYVRIGFPPLLSFPVPWPRTAQRIQIITLSP